MKIRQIIYILMGLSALAAVVSCGDDEQSIPAYLSLDAINVVDTPSDSWSSEQGFFTSKVDAAQFLAYFEGDTAQINLGTFQLPCRLPVLRSGNIKTLTIIPAIKQSGISAVRSYYPYYEIIELDNVRIAPDSLTSLGTISTHYGSKQTITVAWQEFFEPGAQRVSLDSVVERLDYYSPNYADTVLSGAGCGVVRVPDTLTEVHFWTDTTFHVGSPSAYLYLELEYMSDFSFSVGFKNPMTQGAEDYTFYATTVLPKSQWNKMYINLGALWSQYAHYPDIRLFFTILNPDHKSGNLYLDNIKLMVM